MTDQLQLRRDQVRLSVEMISTAPGANWRQVVVTPAAPLSPGRWTLEALPGTLVAHALGDNRLRLAELEVGPDADRIPALTEARFLGFQSAQPGCGGTDFAEVAVSTNEPESMVEVTLTAPAYTTTVVLPIGRRSRTGPLQPNESLVRIGFDMCGGPVRLPAGTTFTASLTPLSAGGRRGAPFLVIFSTPPGRSPQSFMDTMRQLKTLKGRDTTPRGWPDGDGEEEQAANPTRSERR
ncbi:MAG: hypothetical protein JNJ54_19720 [Myxococcaceae bacterium]|nr:hypothetical protein [Myxococcaceae bacterium]